MEARPSMGFGHKGQVQSQERGPGRGRSLDNRGVKSQCDSLGGIGVQGQGARLGEDVGQQAGRGGTGVQHESALITTRKPVATDTETPTLTSPCIATTA